MSKIVFLYGLPSAGKTTIGRILKNKLNALHLDGDDVRKTITNNLGFSKEDRIENMRIVASMAELVRSQEIDVIVSLVAPHYEGRKIFDDICGNLYKVYVSTPPETCYERDVKGLYAKAFNHEIENMTGVGDNYDYNCETTHDMMLTTDNQTPNECADLIMDIFFNSSEN
jgi:adenylylsulfate kinase-like enzyme